MKNRKRREFVVIDAETDGFKRGRIPHPFVWGQWGEDGFHYWNTTDEMIEELSELNIIAYAHNGGKFDFHYMLEYLKPHDEIMIINGRIAKFKIGQCEFRDSWLLMPMPLAGYKKTKIDYGIFEKGEREKAKNRSVILDYLRDDCKYTYDLLKGFFEKYGQKLTIASTAMKYWEEIEGKAPRSFNNFYETFKPYYYGGRVEVFRAGILKGPWKVYDINSAYPFAMMEKHPYGIEYMRFNTIPKEIKGPYFYNVIAISSGALPFKTEKGELEFPNDNDPREFFITGWELITGIETKTVKVIKWVKWFKFFKLKSFSQYVNHFYPLKNESGKRSKDETLTEEERDEALKENIYVKFMLNSLYGKFGANPDKYNKFTVYEHEDMELLLSEDHEDNFGGILGPWLLGQRDLEDSETHYYNVCTSASITGFVRAYLWRAILAAKNVIYCDTDSLVCSDVTNDFVIGSELGEWKFEGEFERAGIAGKKLYILQNGNKKDKNNLKFASKGGKLSVKELWIVAAGGEVKFKPESPSFSVHRPPGFIDRVFKPTTKLELENEPF